MKRIKVHHETPSPNNNHHHPHLNNSEKTDIANNISNHVSQECDECDECDAIKNENKSLFDYGQEISEPCVNADSDSNTINANNNSVFDKSINDTFLDNMDNKQITAIGNQNTDENSVNSEVNKPFHSDHLLTSHSSHSSHSLSDGIKDNNVIINTKIKRENRLHFKHVEAAEIETNEDDDDTEENIVEQNCNGRII